MPALAAATLAIVGLVPLVGPGGSGPWASIAADRLVAERAREADRQLQALEEAVGAALEPARSGAAAVVAGTDRPGPWLTAAAEALAEAEATAGRSADALRALDGALRAAGRSHLVVGAPPASSGELSSIAAQLAATADAADAFVERRLQAERLLGTIGAVVVELEAGRVGGARDELAAARGDHAELEAWALPVTTYPVWVDTAGRLLEAVESLVDATERRDAAAATAAAAEVARLGEDAGSADRALRIALSEGGAAVTAAPLGRVADVLRRAAEARVAVASIMQAVDR